ncbi:S9 family peptidase [Auraticoccus monumenti]|uniref:Dipeptidyl aminopeptidase/acylaminoacyl peptidase n=1 Tax=Auraticoccus monumenti TaxID=675864 RepID=A0A1G7C8Z7_9ACTN|nr:S9 family peptidase [Auraticoccus monumenti]SDE35787.1 Dipeptidyl aminopeptidase/acylaminoacyl peptidase [Auraticoccus monumenti]
MRTASNHELLPRLIDVEELFSDPVFSNPSISPDGTRIAYLAPAHGRRNVWVRGVEEEHVDAVCVTHDDRRGITSYHWSEDSRWLLYSQDTDGNEDAHLYRVDPHAPDDPAVDLTPLPPGSRVFGADPLPSHPGSMLVAMNKRPAAIDLFRIDVATGETTLHHEQTDPTENVLLDQDGSPAFSTRIDADGTIELSAIDPRTGERTHLRRLGGAEHPGGVQPQLVTPDGTGLLVGAYGDSDDLRLIRIDRDTGEEEVVAAVEGSSLDILGTMAPGVLPPVVFTSRRTGAVIAARFIGDRPRIEVLDDGFAEVYAALSSLSDGVLGTLHSDSSERIWLATFVHDRDPAITWLYDHSTGESRVLLRPYPHLDPADLAPMEGVAFAARDGLPLHAFLTLPVGVEPAGLPLVLLVHGGPWMHDTWGYNPQVQLLANRGHAVLQVNFRGSTGYGRRHTTAAIKEFARAMHTDLVDAVDWAVAQGYADPRRVGIMGGSYGGYAALVGAALAPDRFAAAVDYVGVSDLANFMQSLPPFTRPYMANSWYRYVGDPEVPADVEDMRSRSPISMIDRIRTPLLVAQGANDARVVQAESDNIVTPLRERGVPVEYILAADEGHGFDNPANQILLHRAIEHHLVEHLGGRRAGPGNEATLDAALPPSVWVTSPVPPAGER